jgi:hypothetical protein
MSDYYTLSARETAAEYHAREAFSASFAWDWISECPAYAWHHSVFNPAVERKTALEFDIGEATHLLTLEGKDFAARTSLIPYETYQTKEARELRNQCYLDGRTPLRPRDYKLVIELHDALRESLAADLLFGAGESEVSYVWDFEGIACKARADRIRHKSTIIDLKTAASASPQAFQRAMIRDGHHLRAAFYLDGWNESPGPHLTNQFDVIRDYLFVVIAKPPPHLVSVYRCDPRSIEWGRRLYRKALREFRECRETGVFPGYTRERVTMIELPTYAEHALADMEANDEL